MTAATKQPTVSTSTGHPEEPVVSSLDTLAVAVGEAISSRESSQSASDQSMSTVAPEIPESLIVATTIRRGRPRRSDQSSAGQIEAAALSESYQRIIDQIAHDASEDNGGRRRQFVCTVAGCGKIFYQRAHLNIHIRSHTGYKPYTCRHPGCGKAFSQLGNMRTHERKHTGDRPFRCHILQCQKAFTQAGNLKTHLRKVHNIEMSVSARKDPQQAHLRPKPTTSSSAVTPSVAALAAESLVHINNIVRNANSVGSMQQASTSPVPSQLGVAQRGIPSIPANAKLANQQRLKR